MSEPAVVHDTAARGGKGKQVRATDMLNRVTAVPTEPVHRPAGERGPAAEPSPPRPAAVAVPERAPAPDPEPAPTPEAPGPRPRRRLKPTALKLPATITDELRAAMVYLRSQGAWDMSMSQIAQAGIRHELDRLKKVHGLRSFPPVPESSATRDE